MAKTDEKRKVRQKSLPDCKHRMDAGTGHDACFDTNNDRFWFACSKDCKTPTPKTKASE